MFALTGFSSVLLEVQLASRLMPDAWAWQVKAVAGFAVGLVFSFVLNATLNFGVPRDHLWATFGRFALVSGLSFGLNLAAVTAWIGGLEEHYPAARLGCAAVLFLLAYTLHRRYTFDLARDFGIAVYAAEGEDVERIHRLLGKNCDHVHVDLVDETMNPDAAPVDLDKLRQAREFWPGLPVCLHLMSHRPAGWWEKTRDAADWFLFHLDARDDLFALIADCRLRRKKVGVVWHVSTPPAALFPYLPHVDFVMVLGIAQPGRSGQSLREEAVGVTEMLDRLRGRYGFEVMVDGGVNPKTVGRLRAKYVVAASAVLSATKPVRQANCLRTGARYERRAA